MIDEICFVLQFANDLWNVAYDNSLLFYNNVFFRYNRFIYNLMFYNLMFLV